MNAPVENLTGARKAAILMVLLGDDVAGSLLKKLPDDAVASIASEVAEVGTIDDAVATSVLEEFFLAAVRPEEHRGGLDVARRLLDSANMPDAVRDRILRPRHDGASELLGPLLDASPAALATVIGNEHPQTVALVLLNLTPTVAARVLSLLPDELRAGTVQRMTALRAVPGEILGDVVSSLQERLEGTDAPGTDEDEADGLARTVAVLQSMKRSEVRNLLEELEPNDPENAARLREAVYTFETLILADDRGIQELLRVADTKTIALALHGETPQFANKLLDNLSERAGAMLREEIEFLGTVRPEDQQAAQKELIDQALKLEAEEKLVFVEPSEESES